MAGLRKPTTELEHLESGLGSAEDPYQIKDLLSRSVNELADEVKKQIRYSAVSMLQAGRIFMAIKKKLGHGEWEDFVVKQRWSWNYVRASMKLLEVIAKFPQLIHMPGGRVTNHILHLPMPEIEVIMRDLPPETIKKLTPWDLEKIYNQQKLESRPRKKKLTDEEAARILADYKRRQADKAWFEVDRLWSEAVGALNRLNTAAQKIAMEDKHYDDVFKRAMLRALMAPLDELIPKWHPIEEVQKRAEVMKRPSFGGR